MTEKVYPIKSYTEEWDRLARNFAPHIYACKKCGAPTVQGYCCTYCGSSTPEYPKDEDKES